MLIDFARVQGQLVVPSVLLSLSGAGGWIEFVSEIASHVVQVRPKFHAFVSDREC